MKKNVRVVICFFLIKAGSVFSGDINFINALSSLWTTHNATNILEFVESNVATNTSSEVLFARGMVAGYLENWGRGATNYLQQSLNLVLSSGSYSDNQKSILTNEIATTRGFFEALADDASEPADSTAQWNTNHHTIIFNELGDELPLLHIFNEF